MSDVKVEGLTSDNAILLLAAAEELKLSPSVVRTTTEGYFLAPQAVVDKAGLNPDKAAKKTAPKKES